MTEPQGGAFQVGSVPANYRLHLEPVIFGPWADLLTTRVGVSKGDRVLDVAAGTGVVARAAARLAGTGGAVVASDISSAMLEHVNVDVDPDAALIETLECSATAVESADASFDVVLCQQGFPFIPDRSAAALEFRRVLRPGGRAGAAVWLRGAPLPPFEIYADALAEHGVAEPFSGAYDIAGFTMSEAEMREAFVAGGFSDVAVETVEHTPPWASPEAAALGIVGTPYAPAVATMGEPARQALLDDLATRFGDGSGGVRPLAQHAVFGVALA